MIQVKAMGEVGALKALTIVWTKGRFRMLVLLLNSASRKGLVSKCWEYKIAGIDFTVQKRIVELKFFL